MTSKLTEALCTRCGLCCDGTLFADVELGQAEAVRLETMGLEIEEDGANAGLLSQPCAALRGRRCGIYAHRPGCCRLFECHLLQDAQRGVVTVERAVEQIVDAQTKIRRVRDLLVQLGKRAGRLPLKERCAEVLTEEGATTPEVIRKRAQLKAAMSAVERTIWNTFLGSGRRHKGEDGL